MQRALGHLHSRRLAVAWSAWRKFGLRQRHIKELVATSLMRILQHQLHSAFSSWHAWATQRRVLRVRTASLPYLCDQGLPVQTMKPSSSSKEMCTDALCCLGCYDMSACTQAPLV